MAGRRTARASFLGRRSRTGPRRGPGKQVNDDRQAQPTLRCPDVGKVRSSLLAGPLGGRGYRWGACTASRALRPLSRMSRAVRPHPSPSPWSWSAGARRSRRGARRRREHGRAARDPRAGAERAAPPSEGAARADTWNPAPALLAASMTVNLIIRPGRSNRWRARPHSLRGGQSRGPLQDLALLAQPFALPPPAAPARPSGPPDGRGTAAPSGPRDRRHSRRAGSRARPPGRRRPRVASARSGEPSAPPRHRPRR